MQQNILEIKNISKKFGSKIVLNNVSLSIEKGKIYGLIGPNGAGKSTLLKIITGLVSQSTGSVLFNGIDIKKNIELVGNKLGAVIENPDMYQTLSGLNNLKYYASFYDKKINNGKLMEMTRLVGLEKRINDRVSKYSLGMKQRLGLAQALLNDPQLLILDEPTNGLDVNGVIQLRKLLRSLAHNNNISIIISSHVLGEMQKLCDMYAIINNGKIIEQKSIEQINELASLSNAYFARTTYPNFAGKIIEDKFSIKVKIIETNKLLFDVSSEQIPKLIESLISSKINVFEFGKFSIDLEEDFVDAIGKNTVIE